MSRPSRQPDPSRSSTTSNPPTFYPAYTYSASPTWFTWVKLTCWILQHGLHAGPASLQPSFATTNSRNNVNNINTHGGRGAKPTLFYLNHPLQFVQIVGLVVAIEPYHEHFFLFTLDDSSGETVDVLLWKPRPKANTKLQDQRSDQDAAAEHDDDDPAADKETAALLTTLSTLHIGTTVRAKGTLSSFRGIRQLLLLRLDILPDTASELAHIAARTTFFENVLSRPWVLSPARVAALRRNIEGEGVGGRANGEKSEREGKDRERRERRERRWRKLEQREERHRLEILRAWEDEERLREDQAARAGEDGERLTRTRAIEG
jgi:hypothetical protein